MSLAQHLEKAASQLQEASFRIDEARGRPLSLESLREWIGGLTDYCMAVKDLQRFGSESVHEKLHTLAEHARLADVLSDADEAIRRHLNLKHVLANLVAQWVDSSIVASSGRPGTVGAGA